MNKSADAFRTIGEVAEDLGIRKHVLRFWEGRFPQIRPMKRGGGRRYYRPEDMELLRGIRTLLHAEGYTIKGVQKILREHGVDQVKAAARGLVSPEAPDTASPKKRGRKRIDNKPVASTAAKAPELPLEVAPAAESVKQDRSSVSAQVLAAIHELEVARAILLGKPLPQALSSKALSDSTGDVRKTGTRRL